MLGRYSGTVASYCLASCARCSAKERNLVREVFTLELSLSYILPESFVGGLVIIFRLLLHHHLLGVMKVKGLVNLRYHVMI
jgi:hypothetical protein